MTLTVPEDYEEKLTKEIKKRKIQKINSK